MHRRAILSGLAASLWSLPALAGAGDIAATGGWSRPTISAAMAGVVYATLTDKGAPDSLTGVTTPVATSATLHESRMENTIMTMRPVAALPIAPGKPIRFAPDGYHVMLTGLAHALSPGDHFPVTFHFASGATATTEVAVGTMAATGPATGMSMDHGKMAM